MADCLDENELVELVEGRLNEATRERIDQHIDGCAACRGLVAKLAPGDAVEKEPSRGPSFSRYLIRDVVGAGASSVVYSAYDPELDRKVAIKLLRPDSSTSPDTLRARLTREAQAIARLSHPNVISVHEIGAVDDQVFIVMELIDGTTLSEWLRAAPRSWREIVRVFRAAGAGLEAAHNAGIVHRDFKPDNVLISRSDRVYVTDFGLARISNSSRPETSDSQRSGAGDLSVTYSGAIIGTPAYMPPEQMRGATTDARSDVFSFCAALYEALYATLPYRGETLDQLHRACSEGRLEAPRRNVGPRAHRLVIERGLHARPSERPASIGAILRVLSIDPAWQRRRLMAAALAVLAGAATTVGYFELRQRAQRCRGMEARLAGVWDRARQDKVHDAFVHTGVSYAEPVWRTVAHQLDDYVRKWVAMRTAACEATRVQHTQSEALLDRRMSCLDERADELRAEVELFSAADAGLVAKATNAVYSLSALSACEPQLLLDEAPPSTEAQAREVPALRRELSRAMVLDASGRYAQVEALMPLLVATAERLGYGDAQAAAQFLQALVERRRAHPERAVAQLHHAAALAERAHDTRLVARCWRAIAPALETLGKIDEGLMWSDYAEAVTVRAGDDSVQVARVIANRGLLLVDAGRRDEALAEAERALALLKGAAEPETPQAFAALGNVASTLQFLGRLDEALVLRRRVLEGYERLSGHDNPDTLVARNNVIGSLNDLGRYDEALPLVKELVIAQEKGLGPTHRTLGLGLSTLAETENGLHRYRDALAHQRRAVAIDALNAIGGTKHVLALGLLGEIERELGLPEARATLEQALAVAAKDGVGALFVAPARFSLAQLEANRTRARLLATQARDALVVATKDSSPSSLTRARDEVNAWLSTH
jgi:tRNA A-37 threonylcarbamoyl transferase component Bud32/tetratricopeptide (TPR) repeat protein